MEELKLDLVNFEQAKSLNELGFYCYCDNSRELYVTSNEVTWKQEIEIPYSDRYEYVTHHETLPVEVIGQLLYDVQKKYSYKNKFQTVYAPTLELAAKWLRLEKKVNIDIVTVKDNENAHRMGIDVIYQINIFYSVYDEHNQEFRRAYYIDTPLDELIKSYKNESNNWTNEQWDFYDNELENHKYFIDYEQALSVGITKAIEILKNNYN